MGALLFTTALVAQALLGLASVLAALRERAALRRWVASSADPDAAAREAKDLPEPHRSIAAEMAESVRVRSTLDDALVKAVVKAGDESWTPPLGLQVGLHLVTLLLALAPASWALVGAANALASGRERMAPLHPAARYLEGPALLDGPFAAIAAGFGDTALLLATLALVWSLSWWLRRPQVREALLVDALLRVATQIRPGIAAPVGGRLAALVAPERGLARPVAATALWVGAVTFGWAILYVTADVRADNQSEAQYAVWPVETRAPINLGEDLTPPDSRGGRPFEDRGAPTVTVGPMQVVFQGQPLAQLDAGRLATELGAPDTTLKERLATAAEVTVIVQRDVDAKAGLLPVLRWLHAKGDVRTFHLLVRRDIEGGAAQADLPIEIVDEAEVDLTLRVEPGDVIAGAARIPRARPGWRRELATAIRRLDSLFTPEARHAVRVEVAEGVSYARLAEALGAADDSCPTDTECGLPGLGLRFVLGGE